MRSNGLEKSNSHEKANVCVEPRMQALSNVIKTYASVVVMTTYQVKRLPVFVDVGVTL